MSAADGKVGSPELVTEEEAAETASGAGDAATAETDGGAVKGGGFEVCRGGTRRGYKECGLVREGSRSNWKRKARAKNSGKCKSQHRHISQ